MKKIEMIIVNNLVGANNKDIRISVTDENNVGIYDEYGNDARYVVRRKDLIQLGKILGSQEETK